MPCPRYLSSDCASLHMSARKVDNPIASTNIQTQSETALHASRSSTVFTTGPSSGPCHGERRGKAFSNDFSMRKDSGTGDRCCHCSALPHQSNHPLRNGRARNQTLWSWYYPRSWWHSCHLAEDYRGFVFLEVFRCCNHIWNYGKRV